MFVVSEEIVKEIMTQELAYDAIKGAFITSYQARGEIFPVVIAKGCDKGNIFSIKSGNLFDQRLSGLKMGSYWSKNTLRGLPNHNTTIILLDEETGRTHAIINGGYLNGLRTAAANAVATDYLARREATVLGVLGAGHQSIFEIKAICQIRNIKRILINSRQQETAERAVRLLADDGIQAEVSTTEQVCRQADILVTVTSATAPLFQADWIRPGTHISAMGADQSGKQELPIELISCAALYADLPAQSRKIGEFESASLLTPELKVTAIGAVLSGDDRGRGSSDEITIFDSSGIALQDLSIAKMVLDTAISRGLVNQVKF
ncbi:ornithine cyclodeaminase family protein [Paremcibacter congregatus]|uniref:Ornithine cyclodeaminase family protein n=1 Tax=Paremcibacter congregatus TaxID=2043170 RepID=A0A2G4YW41_9PROT|nr:ornithine cyclodeaminase family protein [Paremcibacter congregatus]PHZ86548.1 ornithine cyclodeaminase family protein [Paremcibacter congregatus]QDE26352.1 ornithine cyclodeaminase family protein [Paremcibacter congregatus]